MSYTSSLIELRQKDGRKIDAGEYECNLAKPIIINEGDTILLKQGFIDTKKTSENQIILDDAITLKMNIGYYYTHWIQPSAMDCNYLTANNPGTPPSSNQSSVDGKNYVPYIENSINETHKQWTGWSFKTAGKKKGAGDVVIAYEYENFTGQKIVFHKRIPYFDAEKADETIIEKIDIFGMNNSFKIICPNLAELQNKYGLISNGPVLNPTIYTKIVYSPYTRTAEIVLPAGRYNPSDIAVLISEKLSIQNFSGNSSSLINSPFLLPWSALQSTPTFSNVLAEEKETITGIARNSLNGFSNQIIGASQIALSYNAESNSFSFDYLHTPQRDNVSGQNICVRYIYQDYATTGTPTVLPIGRHSGIFFTGLSAYNSKNEYVPFWDGQLGFDLDKLVCKTKIIPTQGKSVLNLNGDIPANEMLVFGVDLIDGINTTNGYSGLDSAITKNTSSSWFNITSIDMSGSSYITKSLTSTIQNTVNIIAPNTLSDIQDLYSHFLLSADFRFNNDVYGVDIYKQIQGVITKYYSYNGNYTYGDSSGSVEYTHKGIPIYLKSVKLRILKSDKTTDKNLGDDNTFYFQLIKTQTSSHTK